MSLAGNLLLFAARAAAEFAGRPKRSDATGVMPKPVEWQGAATTDSSGNWSVTFPSGLFSKAPLVQAQAIAAGSTAADAVIACALAPTATGCSGFVTKGNVITTLLIQVGANGLAKVGAGVAVHVTAQSAR